MAKKLNNNTLTVAEGEQITLPPSEILIVENDNVRAMAPPASYIQELAVSIVKNGQTMPVIVRPITQTNGDGPKFKLFIGYQRYKAVVYARKHLNAPDLAVLARVIDTQDELGLNLEEQMKRRDLTPLDLSKAISRLKASGLDGKAIGQRMGKTGAWVSQVGKFMSLRPHIQRDIQSGALSITDAKLLNGLDDAAQDDLVQKIKKGELVGKTAVTVERKKKKPRDKRGRKENPAPSFKTAVATFEELAKKPAKDEEKLTELQEWRRQVAVIVCKFLAGDIEAGAVGRLLEKIDWSRRL
jgi:ParB/RepB/Spo0J family partition protein